MHTYEVLLEPFAAKNGGLQVIERSATLLPTML